MKSPPLEWSLAAAYIAALNLLRNHGEPDDDTISENVRILVRKVPFGDLWFTAALFGAAELFRRHIVRRL